MSEELTKVTPNEERAFAGRTVSITETRQQVDCDDSGSQPGQIPGHSPTAASSIQEKSLRKGRHPGQKDLPYTTPATNEVVLPIAGGTLALDSIPESAHRADVGRLASLSSIVTHSLPAPRILLQCNQRTPRRSSRGVGGPAWSLRALSTVIFFAILSAACGRQESPPQPIAFNHVPHTEQEGSCLVCHRGAETGKQAGLAPLQLCVGCHIAIIPDHPEVKKVLESYQNGTPIFWPRVNVIPASGGVQFKHGPHTRAGVSCEACHGDVASMAIAQPVIDLANMGFCLDCHYEMGASVDCLTCHH